MSEKRLAIPQYAVVTASVLAVGVVLASSIMPSHSEAIADEGVAGIAGPPVIAHIESLVEAEGISKVTWQNEVVVPARSLVDLGSIQVDGAALEQEHAERLVQSAADYTARVQFIEQKSVLPSGCELIALAVALQSEGFNALPTELADFVHQGSKVSTDYLGDPARNGGGLPPSVIEAANAWAMARDLSVRAVDLTGTTFDGVAALTKLGYPVVIWTTEHLAEPTFTGTVDEGLQWYRPEHCVVVYGIDGDAVLVSDSLEGLVRRNLEQFSHIYEACGNKAILVEP